MSLGILRSHDTHLPSLRAPRPAIERERDTNHLRISRIEQTSTGIFAPMLFTVGLSSSAYPECGHLVDQIVPSILTVLEHRKPVHARVRRVAPSNSTHQVMQDRNRQPRFSYCMLLFLPSSANRCVAESRIHGATCLLGPLVLCMSLITARTNSVLM